MGAATSATIVEYGLLATEPTVLPLFTALVKFLTIEAYDVHEIFGQLEQLEAARLYILRNLEEGSFTPHNAKTFCLAEIVGSAPSYGFERAYWEDLRFAQPKNDVRD